MRVAPNTGRSLPPPGAPNPRSRGYGAGEGGSFRKQLILTDPADTRYQQGAEIADPCGFFCPKCLFFPFYWVQWSAFPGTRGVRADSSKDGEPVILGESRQG